jgi:hypoxanthine phosphoribosyltransferase
MGQSRSARPVAIPAHVLEARRRGELLIDAERVQRAIDRVAVLISLALQDRNPYLLVVMQGGLPFAGELLRRFGFPLQYGYLHASRYGAATRGGVLQWHAEPDYPLAGRTVLLVDDILDRGETLVALTDWAHSVGAVAVRSAVLVDKQIDQPRPVAADFAALTAPDRYLFGCGMDYLGYWRNLPAIYALPADLEGH